MGVTLTMDDKLLEEVTKRLPEDIKAELEQYRENMLYVKIVSSGIDIACESELTKCPICNREEDGNNNVKIFKFRLNTAYPSDIDNWIESCRGCYKEVVDYYSERWNEYWSMVL